MKTLVYRLGKVLGLFALSRWLTRDQIRVLAYHGIWLGDGHFGNRLYMSAARFEQRMSMLAASGYPVLSLDDALRQQADGSLPDGATVITIDDAWYGTYTVMLPVLDRLRLPSMLYVTSYYAREQTPVFQVALMYMFQQSGAARLDYASLGMANAGVADLSDPLSREQAEEAVYAHAVTLSEAGRQELGAAVGEQLGVSYADIVTRRLFHIMDAAQIREAEQRGMAIELHTHRHRISEHGASCLTQEIADNRAFLEPLVGRSLSHFCYPSGVYEEAVWPEMERNGITTATTTDVGLVARDSHRYGLPRILDGELVSDLEFEAELSGFGEMLRRIRRLIRPA